MKGPSYIPVLHLPPFHMKTPLRSLITGSALTAAIALSAFGATVASAQNDSLSGSGTVNVKVHQCLATYHSTVATVGHTTAEARLALRTCIRTAVAASSSSSSTSSTGSSVSSSSVSSTSSSVSSSSSQKARQAGNAKRRACHVTYHAADIDNEDEKLAAHAALKVCMRAATGNDWNWGRWMWQMKDKDGDEKNKDDDRDHDKGRGNDFKLNLDVDGNAGLRLGR